MALLWSFRAEARDLAARARSEFAGNEVEALLALVQSRRHPLAERNNAVHAIGQIGDPRALPPQTRYLPC